MYHYNKYNANTQENCKQVLSKYPIITINTSPNANSRNTNNNLIKINPGINTINIVKFKKDNPNRLNSGAKKLTSATNYLKESKSDLKITESDEENDFENFKFLLNKLIRNPKMNQAVVNEIQNVLSKKYDENIISNAIKLKNHDELKNNYKADKKKSFSLSNNVFDNIYKSLNNPINKNKKMKIIKDNLEKAKLFKNGSNDINSRNRKTISPKSSIKSTDIKIPTLNFDFLCNNNFNNEFLEKENNFSPSWKEGCKNIKLEKN